MGMHFGIVCAELPLKDLVACVRLYAGETLDRGLIPDMNAFNPSAAEGSVLIAGERDGKSYLVDESLLVSGAEPDLILAMAAAEPTALVVGCGAETVSGTYWLTAARGANMLRSYFHCHSDLSRPFERGKPLATESALPLDADLDGKGLTAALESFGFDFDGWFENGPWNAFLFTGDGSDPALLPRDLGEAQSAHHKQFKLPAKIQPTIKVVSRDKSGEALDVTDTGIKLGSLSPGPKGGFWRTAKKLFSRH